MKEIDFIREDEAILALRSSLGNLQITAACLNISRGQLQDYLVAHPDVARERQQIREALIDDLEEMAFEKAKTSDAVLMFLLRTQAKNRGYVTTNDDKKGTTVNVNINSRTLIAAMRNGFEHGEEEEFGEDSDIFDESGVHLVGGGSGGDREMLSESSILHS